MNLKELLNKYKAKLDNKLDDSTIILKILVEHVFGIKKDHIIAKQDEILDDNKITVFESDIKKILSGVPVQYIVNNQEFMKLNFYVDENVLIPQPDTEILVEEVVNEFKEKECKILDLCTGSGAIAISLAKYIKEAKITAIDISNKALQVAKLNAEKNLVHKKIEFIESNMFENIKTKDFDVIVSNPPYIETEKINQLSEQVKHEPHIALDGGSDGLDFYKIIAQNAYKHLKEQGKLFLEIGYDQKFSVMELLEKLEQYKNIYCKKDLAGNDRVIVAEKRC